MKIAIPVPTHLFALLPIAWDLPEHDFYLVKTWNYDLALEGYNRGMWTHYQPNLHGAFKNVHEVDIPFDIGDYDLLFTIFEGNTTWTGVDKPVVPLDLKIPQIWQAFGSYIHRALAPYLYEKDSDRINRALVPERAVFRWENTVVAEANKDLLGKVIYVSADPEAFNGWVGNSESLLTVYSHKDKAHASSQEIFNILGNYKWTERDYTAKGIQPLSQLVDDMRHSRCYVDPTHRYSPAGFSKIMMTGCPSVAWFHREWLLWLKNEESGFLCGSPKDFDHAIQRLMTDYDFAKQISEASRKRALELFDPKLNHDKWMELIEMAKERMR